MYKQFIRPFLFCFRPETSQKLFLRLARISRYFPGRHIIRFFHRYDSPLLEREAFGLKFPNPVGLAAGFDTDGDSFGALSDFGFGFIEVGSLPPDPQQSSEGRKIIRIKKERALVNEIGTRGKGVRHAIEQLKDRPQGTILSASIAPNPSSRKDEEAIRDYQRTFSLLYDFVDMFSVNISCRNADGVLSVEDSSTLSEIMDPLLDLRLCYDNYKPVLVKISPDTPFEQLDGILDYCMLSGVDGVIAGNTTRNFGNLANSRKTRDYKNGCLSGAPIFGQSLEVVRHIAAHTKGRLPIIACGGIMSPSDAEQMLQAGASLIQLHTGIVYEGPGLVRKILKQLAKKQ